MSFPASASKDKKFLSKLPSFSAHVLIVDLSKPFNHDILANLYESVTGFFSLVTHINGPCRVPLFGLTTVGQYSEVIVVMDLDVFTCN